MEGRAGLKPLKVTDTALDLIRVLSVMMDLSYGRPQLYAQSVAVLAVRLGERLGLCPETLGNLLIAGLLHEIPETTNPSPGRSFLHSKEGTEILSSIVGLEQVQQLVRLNWLGRINFASSLFEREDALTLSARLLRLSQTFVAELMKEQAGPRQVLAQMARQGFDSNHLATLAAIWFDQGEPCAARLSLALPLVNLEALRNNVDQELVVYGIASFIDAKSSWTLGHSQRVAEMAVELGAAQNLPEQELEFLHVTSLLHDVGKVAVPEALLNKPGSLTPEEYDAIKAHARYSGEILSGVPSLQAHAQVARAHHERCDGKGYPDGLTGPEIPLHAKIIAVADSYDAMVSHRPYRKGLAPSVALERLQQGAGTQFEPAVVAALVTLLEDTVAI